MTSDPQLSLLFGKAAKTVEEHTITSQRSLQIVHRRCDLLHVLVICVCSLCGRSIGLKPFNTLK